MSIIFFRVADLISFEILLALLPSKPQALRMLVIYSSFNFSMLKMYLKYLANPNSLNYCYAVTVAKITCFLDGSNIFFIELMSRLSKFALYLGPSGIKSINLIKSSRIIKLELHLEAS
jgi:hypothetical protein